MIANDFESEQTEKPFAIMLEAGFRNGFLMITKGLLPYAVLKSSRSWNARVGELLRVCTCGYVI